MEETGGRGRRRHAAGRHAAGHRPRHARRRTGSGWAATGKGRQAPEDGGAGTGPLVIGSGPIADAPIADAPGARAGYLGGLVARQGRLGARKGRVAAVALVLAGGVVVLLGGVGSGALLGGFGAAPPVAGAAGRQGGEREAGQDRDGAGSPGAGSANGGTGTARAAGTGGTAASGGEGGGDGGDGGTGPEAGAEASVRQDPRTQAPKPAATPGRTGGPRPGTVPGTTAPEDVLAGGPDPGDGDDYRADGPSRHTDHQAAEYFRTNWGPDDKALKRLKDVRSVGGYLRIYTDLPESADNSLTAIILCERGLAYLRSRGVEDPVVFVQAEFGGNGNPVLANLLGPSDRSCRVTHPAPG